MGNENHCATVNVSLDENARIKVSIEHGGNTYYLISHTIPTVPINPPLSIANEIQTSMNSSQGYNINN